MDVQRPEIVHKAQIILYSSLAIGLIRAWLEFPRVSQQAAEMGGARFVIALQAFTFLFMYFNIFFIGKRKNWARYLFAILFICGLPFFIKPLILTLASEPTSGALGIVQSVAQMIALIFLFKAPAREWFKKQVST